jgi:8-oxo-dGTP diphosphatase
MNQSKHKFKTIYWTDDRSSEVNFQPTSDEPPKELISSCFVFPLYDNGVVMSKPKRGWGLPGGHREGDETAEQCVRREADEEASIELGELMLIGRWEIKKVFSSPFNETYPDLAYQLLYVAQVTDLKPFTKEFETSERAVVPLFQVENVHHNFREFEDVFNYIISTQVSTKE